MRCVVCLAVAVVVTGCVTHVNRNAPGVIDVLVPPARLDSDGGSEMPRDPGENVIVASYGGFGAVGGRVGKDPGLASELGVEVGVHWGTKEHSHQRGDTILPLPELVLPERREGINLGWVLGEVNPRDTDELELGPMYLEYARSKLVYGWSAGYAIDPTDGTHGPHVAVNGFGYYAKAGYRTTRGAEFMVGVVLKLPHSFVWSR